jgi:methylglutaconyl-CoA hydratase
MPAIVFDLDARGVATLTLNRPERYNSFDAEGIADFVSHLDRCEREESIRVLQIRGAGKHFCAGANVRELPGRSEASGPEAGPTLPTMLRRLNALAIPSVALVHGACIGGGAGLVACCDVAVAESGAFLSISEVRLGIPPGALVPYFAAAIGPRQLRRYALSGERIDAQRCREIGLVHEVCAPGALDETAAPIVDAFLRGGPKAVAKTKELIGEFAPAGLSVELEAALLAELSEITATAETREGIAAFLEKRVPQWYRPA